VQTIRNIADLRNAVSALRAEGGGIALVPTMGALHAGHLALAEAGKRRAAHVVVSIFVNPTQFGPNEDLDAYPRREASDSALLEQAGVAILWAPDAQTMYPAGFDTSIIVGGVSERWDGAARPGHFAGVATVVTKLLLQAQPDIALFGEKDYQQLAVIRRLVADLDIPVEIVGVPIERDDDGLALSSRNAYLNPEERIAARILPRALGEAASAIERGADVAATLETARRKLADGGFDPIDYVALCDAATLEPIDRADRPGRLLVAATLGRTRLIDNLPVPADGAGKNTTRTAC
jgi:pantoate--beta-alanine ligase